MGQDRFPLQAFFLAIPSCLLWTSQSFSGGCRGNVSDLQCSCKHYSLGSQTLFLYLQISVKKLQSISVLHAKEDSFSIQAHLIHAVKMPELWILLIYHSIAILHLDCVSLLKDIRLAHKQHTHFNNTSWKHSILWGGQKNPRRTPCIARKETCLKAEREVTTLMQHSELYCCGEGKNTNTVF